MLDDQLAELLSLCILELLIERHRRQQARARL